MSRADDWLNTDDRFPPGQALFRSTRSFSVWAYTISHSQLLLRAVPDYRTGEKRVDVLFKPVNAMKVRVQYDGLAIRCATDAEVRRISAENGGLERGARCLMLESGQVTDYVVASAVGWREDDGDARDPSGFNPFAPGTDPFRVLGG